MLHNIFKKITKVTKSKKLIPIIIADIHEKNSLVISELCMSSEIKVEIKSLKIADYIINDIAIERKTVSDLISSMINKRLIEQLKQMKKYKDCLLILEGDLDEVLNKNMSKAVKGFIISISLNYKIPIIRTKDYLDTSNYLLTIAKQQSKPKTQTTLHPRIPKTKTEQKSYILESFPNIGPVKSKKLLDKFNTISNVVNAKEEELEEILKSRARDFKSLLEL